MNLSVGLIDEDDLGFPNLALMKLSAYHKQQGDEAERWIPLKHYDIVYKSKVFDDTYTDPVTSVIMADQIIEGGNAYGLSNKLPQDIEHIYPDYSLYNVTDEAYGYLTRGCPRGCKFCIVGRKEGLTSRQVADLDEFWHGEKNIKLLDPNITACKDCEKLFDQLIESKAYVDFTQGLDVRVITDKSVDQLNQMRIKRIHFAWDNYEMKTYERLKHVRPLLRYDHRRVVVYCLVNFNTTLEQDLERIYKLRELGYDPYVMIYDKPNAPKQIRDLQRWVNCRFIFKTVDRFEDYKRGGN